MPITKPARNARCPCGSGKKYKRCHALSETPYPLPDSSGVWFGKPSIKATYVEETSSPLPEWLLSLAGQWVESCSAPGANEGRCLHALVLITMAGEAVLNRLLEPLVPEADWDVIEGRNTATKWLRLSTELQLSPSLSKGSGPLQKYLGVVDLRNSLVHFKHGKNRTLHEQEFESSWTEGDVSVDFTKPKGAASVITPQQNLHAALHPSKAAGYFDALRDLLRPVLNHHPDDRFRIVSTLKAALGER